MEIKDYETLLKRAYQTAPIGFCYFDTELRYRHINEWLASINGLTVEEHLGRTIDEVIPDVSAEIESILRRVMETGEPILNGVVEAETPALPNQKRFFQHSYHAVTSDEGITVGVNCIVQDITERKRAEESLSKNQERLTLAMDVTSEGLWDWNIATGYMYYSPQWCAALGFDPSEVEPRGRFWASLVHPDDRPHFTEVLNAHFEGKTKTYECEVRLRMKSGEYRWNLDRGKVVAWDDDGRPLRMVGVDVDITERRQAEEAVRESEERYLTLSEASFEGIAIHDQGTVLDVNTRFQEMFGYSLEELKELNPFDCIAPEYRENVRQIVAKGLLEPYETVGLRKDSTTFPMEVQARPMLYRGRYVRVATCQDITKRKRAEEALHETEERTRLLLESAFEGIVIYEKGKILEANQAFADMYGYALEEVIGLSHFELTTPESAEKIVNHIEMGDEKPYEIVARKKDGTPFDVEVVGRNCTYRGHDARIVAIRDITERKRAEEALIARSETERLLLQELDHRVRNNLASLISLIDLSRSGAESVEAFAESIKDRVQIIASVHSALSHSKWNAIELRSLLNTLMDTGDDAHIKFDGPAVIIPPDQTMAVGLIIHELATNSRKYGALSSPNGSVEVGWEEQMLESGARQVHIRWRETGGPPIETEPKPGTGMSLISGLVKSELRGQVDFRFPSHGADHTIDITLTKGSTAQFEVMADATRVDVMSFKKGVTHQSSDG